MKKLLPILLLLLFSGIASTAQTILPFNEGFEKAEYPLLHLNDSKALPGLEHWSYEQTDSGRIDFYSQNFNFITGNRCAVFSSVRFSEGINFLTLTLDLSLYESSPYLNLSFAYKRSANTAYDEDRIWIRGTDTEPWITLFEWRKEGSQFTATTKDFDLSKILKQNMQKPGKSFQMKIGQKGSRAGDLTLDDIVIREIRPENGEISGINTFCQGSSDLKCNLLNAGTKPLNSATVQWWIDGKKQTPYSFKGTLKPDEETEINLGSYDFPANASSIKILVDRVNDRLDSSRYDTLVALRAPGMKGDYTIGKNSNDFATIQNGIDGLNERGMCGSVKLQLGAEIYTEEILLTPSRDLSKDNTLTIEGLNGYNSIILNPKNSRVPQMTLNNMQHVTLNKLNFKQETNRLAQNQVEITGGAESIAIENCQFESTNTAIEGWSIEHQFGEGDKDITIRRNNFIGTTAGAFYSTIVSNNETCEDLYFKDNYIDGPLRTAQFNRYRYVEITGNICKTTSSNNSISLYTSFCHSVYLGRNHMESSYTALSLSFSTEPGTKAHLENNVLQCSKGKGLSIFSCDSLTLHHNTVKGESGFYFSNFISMDMQNNIFAASYGRALEFSSFSKSELTYIHNHWNHYYSKTSPLMVLHQKNYETLQDAIEEGDLPATNFQLSSLNYLDDNLRPSTSIASPRGAPLGISHDIEGDKRCLNAPTIGAYESTVMNDPLLDFTIPDTAYTNELLRVSKSTTRFSSQTNNLYVNKQLVYSGVDEPSHAFTTPGKYSVKLVSDVCGTKDSLLKQVVVLLPATSPKPAFRASRTLVYLDRPVEMVNETTGGVSTYEWAITPETLLDIDGNPVKTYSFSMGTDKHSFNPSINFKMPGRYNICLTATNNIGKEETCRKEYISVYNEHRICISKTSSEPNGRLVDPQGRFLNWNNSADFKCHFTVTTCYKKIEVTFNDFNMLNLSSLKIYEGSDTMGLPLHEYSADYKGGLIGDITNAGFKKTLLVEGGQVHFVYQTTRSTNTPGRGFDLFWKGLGKTEAPNASFYLPDSICTETPLKLSNEYSGYKSTHRWLIEGPDTSQLVFTDSVVNHQFSRVGQYVVAVYIENCFSNAKHERRIVVVEPSQKPAAAIHISKPEPALDQVIQIKDQSMAGNYPCNRTTDWVIEPSTYTLHSNSTLGSRTLDISFQEPICYHIKLKSANTLGFDTLTMRCAISAIDKNISAEYLIEKDRIQVYPNPANEQLWVVAEGPQTVSSLSILNLVGQKVKDVALSGNSKKAQVNTNGLPPGTYLLQVTGPSLRSTVRFQIVH